MSINRRYDRQMEERRNQERIRKMRAEHAAREKMRRRKRRIHMIKALLLWAVILAVFLGIVAFIAHGAISLLGKDRQKDGTPAETTESIEENQAGTAALDSTEAAETSYGEETDQETAEDTITLVMVGDILLHEKVETYCKQKNGSYDYSAIYANTQDEIQAADLALVNEEVIVGGKSLGVSGYPKFNAPNEAADDLKDAGFDVILQANNHAYDMGEEGILNCLSKWNKSYPDIAVLGIHKSKEKQDEIYYYEQNGIKIAILNYTYGITNGTIPSNKTYLVDMLEEERVRADIEEARDEADFVVVCPHWGTEYSMEVNSYQKAWTQLFLEEGVDLVIGTNPHVIQPVEMLENESTGKQMLVYYSLGNFVNWSSSTEDGVMNRFIGGMAKVSIARNADGEVEIADYHTIGLVCHVTSQINGITVYKLSDYSEELAEENEVRLQDSTFSWDYAKRQCDRIWGSAWE